MPTDLATAGNQPPIDVRDRAGVGLPFSRGIMATSILASGVQTDVAYRIAADVDAALRRDGVSEIEADQLVATAADAIARIAGPAATGRYLAWRRVKRSGRPLVLVLTGASGVGKSTIATRLSLRLGINRVLTTDAIRDVLRTVIPATVLDELHRSTYECVGTDGANRRGLDAFDRQARVVASASAAVASRLATEGRSVILEGVHLLPGRLGQELREHAASPLVVEFVLCLDDEALHRARLEHRVSEAPGRGGFRALRHLPAIRSIQAELRRLAREAGIPEHDVCHPEDLTQRIVDIASQKLDETGGAP